MFSSLIFPAVLLLAAFVGIYFLLRAYRPESFGITGRKSDEVENQLRDGTRPSRDFVDRLQELPEDKEI